MPQLQHILHKQCFCKPGVLGSHWWPLVWKFGGYWQILRVRTFNFMNVFLYLATKVWRGIMLYPSVSVRLSVRLSVRPHHFRSITWVFIHGIFSNFAYILLSAMSGMGLLMGKIRPFLTQLLPFFVLEKWFLACYSFTVHDIWMKLHRYVAHQRLHIVTKGRHSDLPSLWVIRPR